MSKLVRSKDNYILGISCFMHDSSACLMKNGEIIAFAEEERFNREKHTKKFPEHAIAYCLAEAGISIQEVNRVGFFWKPWKGMLRRFLRLISSFDLNDSRIGMYIENFFGMMSVPVILKRRHGFKGKFSFISHHESHIAAAYYLSPFKDAAVLSIDGTGEYETAVCAQLSNSGLRMLSRSVFPNSLGLFYGVITEYLGFKINSDEGKVMGLSSYGKPEYYRTLSELISVNDKGVLKFNMKYFNFDKRNMLFHWQYIKGFEPARPPDHPINKDHEDIASSAQKVFEDKLLEVLKALKKQTTSDNLCLNGGVFLNCVANSRIVQEAGFKNVYIFPVSNDAGASIGAACSMYYGQLKNTDRHVMKNIYLGPKYSDAQIESVLAKYALKYEKVINVEKVAAKYLAENKIIGWFQGAMEAGPRALGNRSIIASPVNAGMKDILNCKVKHREPFRPFAPVVLFDRKDDYFEMAGIESPYMQFALPVKESMKDKIPAVVHVDGTARVQTVRDDDNPRLYALIKEFNALTGVPVVLNTSFNVKGEPIVCSPEDAIKCYVSTNIDVLFLGEYIIEK